MVIKCLVCYYESHKVWIYFEHIFKCYSPNPPKRWQRQRLADIFEATVSNTEVFVSFTCWAKHVGRPKPEMFHLTVALQKYTVEIEGIIEKNRAGQFGKILQFTVLRITTENSVFHTSKRYHLLLSRLRRNTASLYAVVPILSVPSTTILHFLFTNEQMRNTMNKQQIFAEDRWESFPG